MRRNTGSGKLPVRMLVWGIVALVMRKTLYTTATDIKGLLLRYQPLEIALTVLTVGVLIRIVLASRKQEPSGNYEACYKADLLSALGAVAAGAGILMTVLTADFAAVNYLALARHYLGLAAPVCLLIAGISRALGKKPFFLLHVVVCLYFLLHIVSSYQAWSSHPQMQDYIFSLLGVNALMFYGFYTAALEADCGNVRMMLGMGLAAIYLCSAELARSSCPWLYLGGMVWVLTDLCSMCKNEEKEVT